MHECRLCGQMCGCDNDDLRGPQPRNCVHLDPSIDRCEAEIEDMSDFVPVCDGPFTADEVENG